MGAPRIVLDTNVLISAFGWQGKPRQIFELILAGELELIISEKQLLEIKRVLRYPRLKFTVEEQQRIENIIGFAAQFVKTHNDLFVIKEDPSDNIMLETAIEYGAKFVVSGDKHLLKIKEFEGTTIVTPSQFLEAVVG